MISKNKLIANGTTVNLNVLLRQWCDFHMLTSFYIKVSYTVIETEFIAETTLKFMNDTKRFPKNLLTQKKPEYH